MIAVHYNNRTGSSAVCCINKAFIIPGFIFLEATLGLFNVQSTLPTWGKIIYDGLSHGAAWGSKFWVLQPISLLLLTGFAFSMMGYALDRLLNPRLQEHDV